jgi:hypothetical protein
MIDLMKHIGQILTVYCGTACTFLLALFPAWLGSFHDIIFNLIGIGTLIYTVYKIVEIRLNIKILKGKNAETDREDRTL